MSLAPTAFPYVLVLFVGEVVVVVVVVIAVVVTAGESEMRLGEICAAWSGRG